MKVIIVAATLLTFFYSSSNIWAQNCKPDYSGQDSITKQLVVQWHQSVHSTGFASSLFKTSQMSIFVLFGRSGSSNYVAVQIQKHEESRQNAELESTLRAAKGNQFFFGIKGGEPLAFVAHSVSNQAKVGGILVGKLTTTVILSSTVSNKEAAALREALTNKQIDAVRIVLDGDIMLQTAVKDKESKKMMEKFECFYQFLDKNPQSQPPPPIPPSDVSIPGRYIRKNAVGDIIDLKPDGTYTLQFGGKDYEGTYTVQDNTITVHSSNGRSSTARISGDVVTFPDGNVYEKQSELQRPPTQLTIDQIIKMVDAKLPDDVIITTVQKTGSKFDLTPEDLIKLKTAGVSDALIRALTKEQ